MNDVRKVIYTTIALFLGVVVFWLSIIYLSACGLTLSCLKSAPKVDRTPVPTLVPATLPAAKSVALPLASTPDATGADIARPSNPGGPGAAVDLTGNAKAGKDIYVANCERCHAAEGKGGFPNSGSDDGSVPPLNPIDSTLVNTDPKVYATNLDLFIEHGSVPAGTVPNFSMPAWGDTGALQPQQIADVIAYIISLNK